MPPTSAMSVSPLDGDAPPAPPPALVQLHSRPRERFVPSRYNARTVGDDGRLILWNTFSGAVSVFKPRDRERVVAALARTGVRAPLDRTGEYLARRGFLVRDDAGELDQFRYRFARQHWRTDVLQLILLASEDCNFRCVYCYERFKHGTMEAGVRAGIRRLVEQRAPRLTHFGISWFGGEPLYGWEAIEELAPFFIHTAGRHGLAFTHHMTTNAYLLTEERATRLLEWGCNSYQVTVDGLAAEHDCKRTGRDGSPTWQTIMDNLRSLAERTAQFQVAIRVNYDRENVPRLAPFIEALSEDFGGDARFLLRFHPVGRWGGENDGRLDVCGTGEGRTALDGLRRQAAGMDLRVEGGIRDVAPMGAQVCYAARPYNFVVGATGKLMKCTVALDDLEQNVVGQIHPDGRMELRDERMARWVNAHFETDAQCRSCYLLPGCQGAACPLTRVESGSRTCSGVRSELKREMRFTLEQSAGGLRAVAAEPVAAGG
ncbi:MAG TPA: radical SAM protein [Longimicrobium sp.]|nr:radical SAM protein [Longimicrobium sp.]